MTDWRQYGEVHGWDNTVSGHVLVWPELHSVGLGRSSEIIVYLPPSLRPDGPGWTDGRRYPTVYFNDGQNVFDDRTANSGEWHADETLEMLAGEGIEAIAVGVPNSAARMDEYNPWRGPHPWNPGSEMGGRGELYLEWLVGSVMPLIDRSFPTSTEREATGIIGSSMGGLISLYALMFQPRAFGFAGVMSPSVRWNDYAALRTDRGRQAAAGTDPSRHGRRGVGRDDRRLPGGCATRSSLPAGAKATTCSTSRITSPGTTRAPGRGAYQTPCVSFWRPFRS